MNGETATEQKERILLENPNTDSSYYDTCVEFGYMPESLDGMWKLHPRVPIVRLSKRWAVAIEATGRIFRDRGVFRPRLVRATTHQERTTPV